MGGGIRKMIDTHIPVNMHMKSSWVLLGDQGMICAIAEVESSRQPLAYRFEPKLNEASTGLMQTLQSTAEWLAT